MALSIQPQFDVVVVGGGIVGASCTLAFARAGLSVALAERDCWGGGATAAGMGHLVVLDGGDAEFALSRHSQKLWQGLALHLPAQAEYIHPGTLWVAEDDEEMQEATRKQEFLVSRGVPAQLLTASALAASEPNLRSGLAGGLVVEQDAVVFPPVVVRWMLDEAVKLGAVLALGHAATHMASGEVRLADGSLLTATRLVNAAGAQAGFAAPGLPVMPRKGHLAITDRYPGFLRHQVVELGYMKSAKQLTAESVACNVQPRATGQILIGSSRQFGQLDKTIDHALLGKMLRRCMRYLPALGSLTIIRIWTGFRASTPDKLPLIGPDPHDSSLWWATGHEGLGITTSLATADLLACAFTGREPAIDPAPYLPARLLAKLADTNPLSSESHKETA